MKSRWRVEASPDSVEAIIETNRAQYSADIDAFAAAHPGENVTLSAADGLTLHGVAMPTPRPADTHPWALCCTATAATTVLGIWRCPITRPAIVIAPDLRLRRQRRRLRRHGLA